MVKLQTWAVKCFSQKHIWVGGNVGSLWLMERSIITGIITPNQVPNKHICHLFASNFQETTQSADGPREAKGSLMMQPFPWLMAPWRKIRNEGPKPLSTSLHCTSNAWLKLLWQTSLHFFVWKTVKTLTQHDRHPMWWEWISFKVVTISWNAKSFSQPRNIKIVFNFVQSY